MATQKIVNGPSKWDIMLSFFDKKKLTFTLQDDTVVTLDYVDGMWNMSNHEPIGRSFPKIDRENGGGGIGEGFLLRGPNLATDREHFVEYRTRSRQGLHIDVDLDESMVAHMPRIWSELMGLKNVHTSYK